MAEAAILMISVGGTITRDTAIMAIFGSLLVGETAPETSVASPVTRETFLATKAADLAINARSLVAEVVVPTIKGSS